jgi:hypothetical protein
MFKCKEEETIYVICSAYYKTGGTELLHQLVHCLNRLGLTAYITYLDAKKYKNPINNAFRLYVKEYKNVIDIVDEEDNIVILPEIQVKQIEKFKRVKTVVWWLSVDNYLKVYTPLSAFRMVGIKGVLWYIKNRNWHYRIKQIKNKISYNFAQSNYAIDFLKKNKFMNIQYLSDYISNDYLKINLPNNVPKNDTVLYNPKKGMKFTKQIMAAAPDLKWIPLINMTNDEVRNVLRHSKVYIDFGNHPGKDRFPREAAYCGCCVITGLRGSAAFYQDVSINDCYKFHEKTENIPSIVKTIRENIKNYEVHQKDFEMYRSVIDSEKKQFEEDVRDIFLT